MSVLDILKTFGEASRDEIINFPNSDEVLFNILIELEYVEKSVGEDDKDYYTLTDAGNEQWRNKKNYGDNIHQDYQFSQDEFKVLQMLRTHGPMTVAELFNVLLIDAMRAGNRLRHVELVSLVQKTGSNSTFWAITEEQKDEMVDSLVIRANDEFYSTIAVEVAALETSQKFESSFYSTDKTTSLSREGEPFQPGELLILVNKLPETDNEDYKTAFVYLKKILESTGETSYVKGFLFPSRQYTLERRYGASTGAYSTQIEKGLRSKVHPEGLQIYLKEVDGLKVTHVINQWFDYFVKSQKPNDGVLDPDYNGFEIIIASVYNRSEKPIVVDAIVLRDAHPSKFIGVNSFHQNDAEEYDYNRVWLSGNSITDDINAVNYAKSIIEK